MTQLGKLKVPNLKRGSTQALPLYEIDGNKLVHSDIPKVEVKHFVGASEKILLLQETRRTTFSMWLDPLHLLAVRSRKKYPIRSQR